MIDLRKSVIFRTFHIRTVWYIWSVIACEKCAKIFQIIVTFSRFLLIVGERLALCRFVFSHFYGWDRFSLLRPLSFRSSSATIINHLSSYSNTVSKILFNSIIYGPFRDVCMLSLISAYWFFMFFLPRWERNLNVDWQVLIFQMKRLIISVFCLFSVFVNTFKGVSLEVYSILFICLSCISYSFTRYFLLILIIE